MLTRSTHNPYPTLPLSVPLKNHTAINKYMPACMHARLLLVQFSSVQFSSVAQSCPTLCDPMNHSTPGLPVHHQLPSSLRLTSIESVMPSSHLILCRPLLPLPLFPPSIRVFSNESNSSHDVAKVLEFQL